MHDRPTPSAPGPKENENFPPSNMCNEYHGIDSERWTVDPHPTTACDELIEMGSVPSPSLLEALMTDG